MSLHYEREFLFSVRDDLLANKKTKAAAVLCDYLNRTKDVADVASEASGRRNDEMRDR